MAAPETLDETTASEVIHEHQAEVEADRQEDAAEAAGAMDDEPMSCSLWEHCAFTEDHPGVCRDIAGSPDPRQAKRVAAAEAAEAEAAEQEAERAAKRAEKEGAAAAQAEEGTEALTMMAARSTDLVGPSRLVPGTDIPIVPSQREMAGLAAMAVTLSAAQALPSALRNRPNDVFLVLITARDLGVAVTTALREFHVIDGKVTISPKAKLAMLNERGARMGWAVWPDPGNNAKGATWHATRADRPGIQFSYSFTLDDAVTAGLAKKDNWKGYPQRMLSWRALGYLMDDVFPEVGTGLYSPDEMGAVTDEEGNPVIDVRSMDPLMGMRAPVGQNRGGGGGDDGGIDAPAPEEEREALRVRLDALKPEYFDRDPEDNSPTARDALMMLWLAKDADGNPREGGRALPPWSQLTVGQMRLASAMVAGIESRAKKGEWGAWAPLADPETGEVTEQGTGVAPVEPSDTEESPTPGDGENQGGVVPQATQEGTGEPGGAVGAPTPEPPVEASTAPQSPEPDLVQQIIDRVGAMGEGERRAELAKRKLPVNGAKALQQQRLAEALLKEALAGGSPEAEQ